MINPLTRCVEDYALPPYNQFQPTDLVPAVRAAIDEFALDLNSIEDDLSDPEWSYTWGSVMDRLEIIDDPLTRLSSILAQLVCVANCSELRAAQTQVQPELNAIWSRRAQNPVIFQAMITLRTSKEWNEFTSEQERILDRSILRARLAGVGLDDAAREQFNKMEARLKELRSMYSNNVLDATKAYSKIVHDRSVLDGVPQSALSSLAKNAVEAGCEGATAANGPWKLSLDMPSFMPVMRNCMNRDLREELFRENIAKAGAGSFDNTPVIEEILALRHEIATMLGFQTYAELSIAEKMAPSVAIVQELMDDLFQKCRPIAESEHAELQAYAKAHGQESPLEPWDIPFWTEHMRRELFELNDETIKPYFPLPRVLAGLFDFASRLFGIEIEAANGEEETWHPEVLFFNIRAMEQPGTPVIAQFYLDPYARPGSKRHSSWIDVIVSRSKVLRTEKAPVRLPVFSLAFNLTPPVDDVPSLMTFLDVQHLFLNFGYGLRVALTEADYTAASGFKGVEWDAVEIPSQFMENFCYSRDVLPLISGHYETGAPLPQALFEKLIGGRQFRVGTFILRQLFLCALDMALHNEYNPKESIYEVQSRIAERYCIVQPLPEDRHLCSFNHIFSGGYAAGYYSYLWSEILSSDAYQCFEEAQTPQEYMALGRKFRDTVLARVGVVHPMEALEHFLGRKPSTTAILKRYGLIRSM